MGAKAQSGLRRLSEPWLYATWPTGCTAGPSLPLCWLHRSPAISDPKSLTEALNQLRPCPTLWVGAGDGVPSPADPEHLPSRTGTHAHLSWGGGQCGRGKIEPRTVLAASPLGKLRQHTLTQQMILYKYLKGICRKWGLPTPPV